jgi:RNA:NAD 2'-phosphotransferase (TPT1/KptA family)
MEREEVQDAREEKRANVNEVELRSVQGHSSKVPVLIAFAERRQQTRCGNP